MSTYRKRRRKRCLNCEELFERTAYQATGKKFCSDKCRKEWHRYGGIPRGHLLNVIRAELKKFENELKPLVYQWAEHALRISKMNLDM